MNSQKPDAWTGWWWDRLAVFVSLMMLVSALMWSAWFAIPAWWILYVAALLRIRTLARKQ